MSNCPSQFALAVKEAGEPFANLLTDDDLLNLADPTKRLNTEDLSAATKALNEKFDEMAQVDKDATHTYEDFAKDYEKLKERLDLGPLTTPEVAIFASETGAALTDPEPGQVSLDVSDWIPGAQIPAPVVLTLGLMSGFFDDNMGKSLSGGQCAQFGLAIAGIGGLLNALKSKADSLDGIPGLKFDPLNPPSLKDLIDQKLAQLQLDTIQKTLQKTIDGVLQKVQKTAGSISAGLKDIDGAVTDATNRINAFTSDKNKNGMMDGVEKMVANLASGFEKIDLKTLGLLMFRLCQVSEAIQASGEKPLTKLIAVVSGVDSTKQAAASMSAKASERAVDSGATRMDPADVSAKKEEIRDTQRNLSGNVWDIVEAYKQLYGENNDGIGMTNDLGMMDVLEIDIMKEYPKVKKARHLPKNEREWVKALKSDTSIVSGIGPIKFEGAYNNTDGEGVLTHVDKAGRDTGAPGPGWTNVHESLWVQIIDMARQLGTDVRVSHAWKYDTPNKFQKKGFGVKILFDDNIDNALAYTIAASRAGVKTIITDANEITLLKHKRGYNLGKKFRQEKDNAINTTLPASEARIDALNRLSSYVVRGALRFHQMDNWQYYVAPAVGASAPPQQPPPLPTSDAIAVPVPPPANVESVDAT